MAAWELLEAYDPGGYGHVQAPDDRPGWRPLHVGFPDEQGGCVVTWARPDDPEPEPVQAAPASRLRSDNDDDIPSEGEALDRAVAVEVFGRQLPTDEEMRAEAERVWTQQPLCRSFIGLGGFYADAGPGQGAHFTPAVTRYCEGDGARTVLAWMRAYETVTIEVPSASRSSRVYVSVGVRGSPFHDPYPYASGGTLAGAICRAAIVLARRLRQPEG